MEHDDLSVLRQLNVELDSVAVGRGTLERGQRILRHGFITFMQPTVGKITVLERRFLLLADLAGSNEVYKSADSGSSGKCGKLCGVYLFFHYNTSGEHFYIHILHPCTIPVTAF